MVERVLADGSSPVSVSLVYNGVHSLDERRGILADVSVRVRQRTLAVVTRGFADCATVRGIEVRLAKVMQDLHPAALRLVLTVLYHTEQILHVYLFRV